MSTRSRHHASAVATIAGALGLLFIGFVAPASATTVTFTVEGGFLVITPTTANPNVGGMSTSGNGQAVSGALGTGWVSDTRGPAITGWIATVTSSDFTGTTGATTSGTVTHSVA